MRRNFLDLVIGIRFVMNWGTAEMDEWWGLPRTLLIRKSLIELPGKSLVDKLLRIQINNRQRNRERISIWLASSLPPRGRLNRLQTVNKTSNLISCETRVVKEREELQTQLAHGPLLGLARRRNKKKCRSLNEQMSLLQRVTSHWMGWQRCL